MKLDNNKLKILIELTARNEGHKINYVRKCLINKLGITAQKLSLIESGKRNVSTIELMALQDFFKLDAGYFVKREGKN